VGPHNRGAVVELVWNVKGNGNGKRKVDTEEALQGSCCAQRCVIEWCNSHVELRNEDKGVEDCADPGANHAGLRSESEFGEAVALSFPALAEADMGYTDGEPCEDGGKSGEC
jgi:hypothetical protein